MEKEKILPDILESYYNSRIEFSNNFHETLKEIKNLNDSERILEIYGALLSIIKKEQRIKK